MSWETRGQGNSATEESGDQWAKEARCKAVRCMVTAERQGERRTLERACWATRREPNEAERGG
ncbi:hypothetical protein KCTCHS21_40630 [Cohnella abietis]|uniref:Uncharacterized protein n=1 Tax=Cohnella abietis TaxID=2507935 RepID=A0A3T1D9B6_9BACL|nr:hypothetical protein KCTCHS21_40630 [Cohnella abietis]